MPDVKTTLSLDSMTPQDLDLRRREIVATANGDYENLSLDDLKELAAITSAMRRRTAGPPKALKSATKGAAKKPKPTLNSLLEGLQ